MPAGGTMPELCTRRDVQSGDPPGRLVSMAPRAAQRAAERARDEALAAAALATTALEGARREADALAQRGEAASRAKSIFLANLSHELRTPMNGLLGMGDLLGRTNLDAQQRHLLGRLEASAHDLLDLLNDLIDLAASEAGTLTLTEGHVDPAALVAQVAEHIRLVAEERGLTVAMRCDPALPSALRGDPVRLRQCLLALADNAVRFTPAGQVELSAAPGAGAAVGCQRLLLGVRDTGPGISIAQRDHLGDPFTQGDSASTRRHGGVGLGLATASRLAALMGGRLEVADAPGGGALVTICIDLPIIAQVPAVEASPAPAAANSAAVPVDAAADLPAFDAAALMHRLAGDAGLARRVGAIFLAELPGQLAGLAAAGADLPIVLRLAHTIKGAASNLGATALGASAARLELAARSGDLAPIPGLITTTIAAAVAFRAAWGEGP